jgi:hypothetical protein
MYYFCVLFVGYGVKFRSRRIFVNMQDLKKRFTEKAEEINSTKLYITNEKTTSTFKNILETPRVSLKNH